MSDQIIVKAMDMRRNEWICYRWIYNNSPELTYMRLGQRPIEESIDAAKQFDMWVNNARHTLRKVNHGELAPPEKMP